MIANLEEAQRILTTAPLAPTDDLQAPLMQSETEALGGQITSLLTMLRQHGDHPEYRIGNEVILMQDEMRVGDMTTMQQGSTNVQGGMSDTHKEITLAGLRYMLANIDNKDDIVMFAKDTHRGVYRMGMQGHEQTISHDTPLAKQTVLELTGGNERIAKALMSITHQGLMAPLTAALADVSLANSQCFITPGNTGNYQITRLADNPEGTQVYRIGSTFDSPLTSAPTIRDSLITMDPNSSKVSGEVWLQVTCHPNGVFEPVFDGEPSFAYQFTKAPEA